eukprot:16026554-Heterocapsa_arctica.AAC.1
MKSWMVSSSASEELFEGLALLEGGSLLACPSHDVDQQQRRDQGSILCCGRALGQLDRGDL